MAKVQVGLRLEVATAAAVDAVRGEVPRNRWIERLIESELVTREVRAEPEEAQRLDRALAQSRAGALRGSEALGQALVGEARQEAAGTVDPGPVPAPPPAAPAEAPKPFRCSYGVGCKFRTTSAKAICPIHGRKVVAV